MTPLLIAAGAVSVLVLVVFLAAQTVEDNVAGDDDADFWSGW